jgi:hypothetical protein
MGAAAALALLPGGCSQNDNPKTTELDGYFESHPYVQDPRDAGSQIVSIVPASVTIDFIGGKAVLKAGGGTPPYRWDVSRPLTGAIAPSGVDAVEAVYTAIAIGENNVIVYDQKGYAAIADITGTPPAPPAITASPATLAVDNAVAVVEVTGGTAPYTWAVMDPTRGNYPSGNTGATVVYKRYAVGDNAVIVTDATGARASLVISQP